MKKLIAITFVILLLCTSCANKKDSTNQSNQPITNQQASVLSRLLYRNHQHKGATYVAVSGDFPDGFVATGTISWNQNPTVHATVSLLQMGQVDLDSIITTDGVYETLPQLTTSDVNNSFDVSKRVLRPYDPTKYGVDALGQFLIKLASDAPDNPILLKQDGALYLGSEVVGDEETSRFKISDSITYYVTKSGDLKRVIAHIKGFKNPVVVSLSNFGEQEIELPVAYDVINFDEIKDVYLAHRPAF